MKNWRTVVGALCIVLAMLLGAFAGFAYARPGVVGASPNAGTRAEDRRLTSVFDESQKLLDEAGAADIASNEGSGPASLLSSQPTEITAPGGATARRVSPDEQKDIMGQAREHLIESDQGTITLREEAQTGTRSHWVGGEVDAGGPYGGPDTLEGETLTIIVTIEDPTIIFLRYDLDGDGIFDYPDQTGGGTLGKWTTLTTITKTYYDNFYTDIVVEGWDGVSTIIQISSGDNLDEQTAFQWFIGYGGWNFAWKFRAKADMTVTELGHYHYVYPLYAQGLWDTSGNLLGSCTPAHSFFAWNWCTLSSPVDLFGGEEYLISISTTEWETAIDTPSDTPKVEFQGTYYCYNYANLCYPNTFWVDFFIPLIDFLWTEVLVLPDTTSDTAQLEVNNVAPTVSDVLTDPSPGLEGNVVKLSAFFEDPGLDDTWEYRWMTHDGEVSDWRGISKFSGGARVLILHSWTFQIDGIQQNVVDACGNFCTKVDELDFGPLGQSRIPTLDELTAYDVLLVGTNWGPIPNSNAMGDRLAEFMDAAGSVGGGIVMMSFGFYSNSIWGIGGRWETEKSPLPRAGSQFFTANLGTIYVPGHPFLDGVSDVSALYRQPIFDVTSGAIRVADWTDGTVFGAEKTDDGGRIACGLNYFPSLSVGGDYAQVIANAIRYCSRQPDPVLKTMPIQLDPFSKIYRDDHPTTTTPEDTFTATVEVRDDDHNRVEIHSQQEMFFSSFEISECSGFWGGGSTWPAGWYADPDGFGWVCEASLGQRGPTIWYYYNDPLYGTGDGNSYVYTDYYDFSSFMAVRMDYYHDWQADFPSGDQHGYIQASIDGGATWINLQEYHHNAPAQDQGDRFLESFDVGGSSNVQFRFYYVSNDDWWWMVDNVRITGIEGEVMNGLGATDGFVTLANVAPSIVGGFDSALRMEASSLRFDGYEITDPALIEPTEWFAWSVNMDDGTPSSWNYAGSLAPPKFDILVVHTICLSGGSCGDFQGLRNLLLAQDDVGVVDQFNFINFPSLPTAPSLATLLQYDVIIVATNWAYFSFPPFDLARRQVGDRLASYVDAGRGGVLTMMAVYDLSTFAGDIFTITGRYKDDDYGAFENMEYTFIPQSTLGTRYDPGHDIFVKVGPNVGSFAISPGDMPLTVGGRNNAVGQNGVLLADWPNGNSAIGTKELINGMRTAHYGAYAVGVAGFSDSDMLLRNMIGWVGGGIPSPKIPAFNYIYGDNGIYTVDFTVIDDDMGFTFDTALNMPVEDPNIGGVQMSHRFVTVSVDNVDPVITSMEAFMAGEVCVRIDGTVGNSVTADVYTDGVLALSLGVTRMDTPPAPKDDDDDDDDDDDGPAPTETCGLLMVDVTASHTYDARLTYSGTMGGSNNVWLVIQSWRDPVSRGHGSQSYFYRFSPTRPSVVDQPLPTLKGDLFDGGRGAPVDFAAEAFDAGTDDLAFFWSWGSLDPVSYAPLLTRSVYSIHVHHNNALGRSDGALLGPQFLGFSELYFDRPTNDGRSSLGTMDFRVRDTAFHAFGGGSSGGWDDDGVGGIGPRDDDDDDDDDDGGAASQHLYYVMLLVLDDDNTRNYPSTFTPNDGVDMQFLVIDLSGPTSNDDDDDDDDDD